MTETSETAKIVAEIIPMKSGNITAPTAKFKGGKPAIGKPFRFVAEGNGVTYEGTVKAAEEVEGFTIVEFENGLKPVTE